jgi:hypothetical protein
MEGAEDSLHPLWPADRRGDCISLLHLIMMRPCCPLHGLTMAALPGTWMFYGQVFEAQWGRWESLCFVMACKLVSQT